MVKNFLLKAGKQREYALGQLLRERYDAFLGKIYLPKDVMAMSTNVVRTKMSLLLVLAGLYPPVDEQNWNPAMHWQPIPITYVTKPQEMLFGPRNCRRFVTRHTVK